MEPTESPDEFTQRHAVLVVDLAISSGQWNDPPNWTSGPFPFSYRDRSGAPNLADAASRSSYFHSRVTDVLYGAKDQSMRWHLAVHGADRQLSGAEVIGIEVLRAPPSIAADAALGVIHLHLPAHDPIGCLSSAVQLGSSDSATRTWIDRQLAGSGLTARASARRASTMAFFVPADRLPSSQVHSGGGHDPFEQWLWLLASATPTDRFRPDPTRPLPPTVALSASWRCMVLRDGIGFIGLNSEDDDEFLRTDAATYVRSLYLDVLLIGRLQLLAFDGLADELSNMDWAAGTARLRHVEKRLSTIRNTIWGAHLTSHEAGNNILKAYQDQHDLRDLVNEVQVELADAARLAELDNSRRVELLLTVLTIVSSTAALAAVWHDAGTAVLLLVVAVSAALLATVYLVRR